jgi:MFS family permease
MEVIEIRKNFKPMASLIGGFILMLYFGSIYITGNIAPYIQAYLQSKGGKESCTDSQIYLLLPGITIIQTLIMPFAGFLQQRVNYRLILTCSISFGLALFTIASFTTTFWPFFICYCGGFGIMLGLAYTVPLYNNWKHFP